MAPRVAWAVWAVWICNQPPVDCDHEEDPRERGFFFLDGRSPAKRMPVPVNPVGGRRGACYHSGAMNPDRNARRVTGLDLPWWGWVCLGGGLLAVEFTVGRVEEGGMPWWAWLVIGIGLLGVELFL